jgi:hypothetical protein
LISPKYIENRTLGLIYIGLLFSKKNVQVYCLVVDISKNIILDEIKKKYKKLDFHINISINIYPAKIIKERQTLLI